MKSNDFHEYGRLWHNTVINWLRAHKEEYAKREDIPEANYEAFASTDEVLSKWYYTDLYTGFKALSWMCGEIADFLKDVDRARFDESNLCGLLEYALRESDNIASIGLLLSLGEHLAENSSVGLDGKQLGSSFVWLIDEKTSRKVGAKLSTDGEDDEEEEEDLEEEEEEELEETDTEEEEEEEEEEGTPFWKVYFYDKPKVIPCGERNTELFRFATHSRRLGAGKEEIMSEVEEVNKEMCKPPLSDREVRMIVESAMQYGSGK